MISKEDKWKLNMWEHSTGISRAEKEWNNIPSEIIIFAQKRISVLMKSTFTELKKAGYLGKIKGISRIKITVPKNQIRIFGVECEDIQQFDALHIVHKKNQTSKKKDIDLASERLKEYKIIN
jgi:phage-related protein